MAVHIINGENNIKTNREYTNKIHYIPFKIHADCDAEVAKYFLPSKSEDELFEASFRGYPLLGKEVKIPDDYKGLVLHETIRPATEKEERKFYVIHSFDKFTYWNWGKAPSKNDSLVQALDWISIAEALHSPVDEE